MRPGRFGVTSVLVGLRRVGLVGLRDAFEAVEASGLEEREAVVGLLLARIAERNHVSPASRDAYGETLWREWRRHRGEDISDLFDRLPVEVRGDAGAERDALVALLTAELARLELRPDIALEPGDGGPVALLIHGEEVVRGLPSRPALERAVKARLSEW